ACRRTLREEMGVEPSPETVALFQRVRAASVPPRHNLPHPAIPFVGRARLLHQVSSLLADPECQLITLTGPAGSGKTRLALQAARGFAAHGSSPAEQPFPDGIFLVNLAESRDCHSETKAADGGSTDALMAALESTLLAGAKCRGRTDVLTRLCGRAMLLVLDNFDHLEAAPPLLSLLLERAPRLKVLVTSRAPLQLSGERVLQIDGLCVPQSEDEIDTADASALFLQEARRVALDYQLCDRERAPLVRLCQLLRGQPLQLLLAARWTPVLSCAGILAEIEFGSGLDVQRPREMAGV
ncbi:MAG: AAA family ATPase, partial [Chloroflexi bacterium]|nr:AAA family ATPase [Chloroflexota bacterium]